MSKITLDVTRRGLSRVNSVVCKLLFLFRKDIRSRRLAAHLRDYHPIERYQASLDLDADPPEYAADFQDIKGQMSTQK